MLFLDILDPILVPRGRAPFGQHQIATSVQHRKSAIHGLPVTLRMFRVNLLCLQSHSKTECRWRRPEVAILGADQKERGLWGRECLDPRALVFYHVTYGNCHAQKRRGLFHLPRDSRKFPKLRWEMLIGERRVPFDTLVPFIPGSLHRPPKYKMAAQLLLLNQC